MKWRIDTHTDVKHAFGFIGQWHEGGVASRKVTDKLYYFPIQEKTEQAYIKSFLMQGYSEFSAVFMAQRAVDADLKFLMDYYDGRRVLYCLETLVVHDGSVAEVCRDGVAVPLTIFGKPDFEAWMVADSGDGMSNLEALIEEGKQAIAMARFTALYTRRCG